MTLNASQGAIMRFSTRDLPASQRVSYWREVFGRQICRVDIEPQTDDPMDIDAALLSLPNLHVGLCHVATPACMGRTPDLVKDGDDSFVFVIPLHGAMTRFQRSDDLEVDVGEGAGILHAEPGGIRFHGLHHIFMMVPQKALSPLVADLEDVATRLVPRRNEALRLLRTYVGALFKNADIADLALGGLVATHIHDLVALAIGATRDGQIIAAGRGVRAARVSAIKADFIANPALKLCALAARQRVTPRYVQLLFEEQGTTFTAYALEQRLLSAWRMLNSPRAAHLTISAIAFEAGFGDLSHFNRRFKYRFGASPSQVRAETTCAASCSPTAAAAE
jgi:AraC-like DNA-binding protein